MPPRLLAIAVCLASPIGLAQSAQQPPPAQQPRPQQAPPPNPYPTPIEANEGVIALGFTEFAALPDAIVNGNPVAPRMMMLADEPSTKRLFVSTMTGMLYSVSYDGKTVTPYLDLNAAEWAHPVQAQGSERGFQSFAFHPDFNRSGRPGFGRFYTYFDTTNTAPKADFVSPGPNRTHDTVLLEWTARNPAAATYDGAAPRELFRAAHPFGNHNGGQIAFNPLAKPGEADFGLLYVGFADGGSGGDPFNLAQDMTSAFGKILRIDPLGKNGANGRYGIPASNPFVKQSGALAEIYALGVRNPQRFSWDSKTGRMYVADIGQNVVEEVSPVTAGANLGWNKWEASFAFAGRSIDTSNPRGDKTMTWPVAEYDHTDPLLQNQVAVTGVYVYRHSTIKPLTNLLIFGDNPSGEIFYVPADAAPNPGQASIRRILLDDNGARKTLLQVVQEKNTAQGRTPARRADLRFGVSADGQIFLLNKRDGIIRRLTAR
ncbi:MAG TPA: PQQ-dependent sugar dehydrogenase [Vicinamibacterales bacterium]|nr:PQQ-dependent sugar dehydrogenase [Vicinamibacterales bacterium]